MTDDRDPVVVAAAPDVVGGGIAACALQSARIPAELFGARTGRPHPAVNVAHGSVHPLVPRALETDAKAILAELGSGS